MAAALKRTYSESIYPGSPTRKRALMPEIVADPLSPPGCHLLFAAGIVEFQLVVLISFGPRAGVIGPFQARMRSTDSGSRIERDCNVYGNLLLIRCRLHND
jgi:hypothetical protein